MVSFSKFSQVLPRLDAVTTYKVPVKTHEISSNSTLSLIDAVEHLHFVAVEIATAAGLEFHSEQSHSSEAVYCSVRHGRYWYGVRIAAHEPVYTCSNDYTQVIVPQKVAELKTLRRAERRLADALRPGGMVVAAPTEVNATLLAATEAYFQRTGRTSLPNSEACAIRHRLHFRARWTFDEEQAANHAKP